MKLKMQDDSLKKREYLIREIEGWVQSMNIEELEMVNWYIIRLVNPKNIW